MYSGSVANEIGRVVDNYNSHYYNYVNREYQYALLIISIVDVELDGDNHGDYVRLVRAMESSERGNKLSLNWFHSNRTGTVQRKA